MSAKIFFATSNDGKLKELASIAEEFGLSYLTPKSPEFENRGPWPEVEEKYSTFFENAREKAEAWCRWSGLPTVADDSGLEVLALDGFPGVRSARWAGSGVGDLERCQLLLEKMKEEGLAEDKADRWAQFRCSLVCVYPESDGRDTLSSEGILKGTILKEPKGSGGFGYDPIVFIDRLERTLAEIDFTETLQVGFRAKAARELFSQMVD